MEHKHETPSKTKNPLINKVLNSCDSPFRFLPNVSTPPSRFAKIRNPFEAHLLDRLHLPTFNSPNVFSTIKNQEKFRWDIEEISTFQPADIDEATISQHVSDHDPTTESIVQEKIEKFFNEKIIVPSPMNQEIERIPLLTTIPECTPKLQSIDNAAQTVLTLPPILPVALEELLKPYFNYTEDQQKTDLNTSLYRKLFECDDHDDKVIESVESSPALSTGLSPIQLSPVLTTNGITKGDFESPIEMTELKCCNLSPIERSPTRNSRSVCRLSFSGNMSLDNSLVIVPDINRLPDQTAISVFEQNHESLINEITNTTMDWDMEYKHVSILSKSPNTPKLIKSNSNTPRSARILSASHRKRLSDSFKDEQINNVQIIEKSPNNNGTDTGYMTGENSTWNGAHMFASTPTKSKN